MFFGVLLGFLEGLIARIIINEKSMIVGIILHYQGLQHLKVSIILNIIVTDDDNAESSFIAISPFLEVFSPVVQSLSEVEEMMRM